MLLSPGLLLAVGALTGCPSRDVSAVDPAPSKEQQKEIPVNLNRNIDILWVIDNSGSMEQEQRSLANNFPEFARVLEGIEGGLPNIHMAVVSSNVGTQPYDATDECQGEGDNGEFQVGACPLTDGFDLHLGHRRRQGRDHPRQELRRRCWPISSRAWPSSAPTAAASSSTSSR